MDTNKFVNRHVGIAKEDIPAMLKLSVLNRLTTDWPDHSGQYPS